ncbi:MAG: SMP-30/gluconolactonase/LRE family protein, partial [Chloroflexi bacterium]|nr:SMP-30/gluconolactonase/LRE family protein [Chloroflexota bacterium]
MTRNDGWADWSLRAKTSRARTRHGRLRSRAVGLMLSAAALTVGIPATAPAAQPEAVIKTYAGEGNRDPAPAIKVPQQPTGVTVVDGRGEALVYVLDSVNHALRVVDTATGIETLVAGNNGSGYSGDGGPATVAQLSLRPDYDADAVSVDGAGDVFIADSNNNRVRRVDAATKVITTVAGTGTRGFSGDGGPATAANLNNPTGLVLDAAGNLFIAERDGNRVRRVDALTGVITTVAGTGTGGFGGDGGPATAARLHHPHGLALDSSGNLFIADQGNQRIRRVDAATQEITTVAGNGTVGFGGDGGPATSAQLAAPDDVAVDSSGDLFIPDRNNDRIRRVDASTQEITTVAGNGTAGYGGDGGLATAASLQRPRSVALDASANMFVADTSNYRVRRVDRATGIITTVAGNGTPTLGGDGGTAVRAQLALPIGVARDASGNLYIADASNHAIRRIDAATGVITTVAGTGNGGFGGDDGPATSARLNVPNDVAVDSSGNLYIADTENRAVRKVDAATGTIRTMVITAGAGVGFSLGKPLGLTVDSGDNVFISVEAEGQVYKVDAKTGAIVGVSGNQFRQASGDGDGGIAADARIVFPAGLAVDGADNLFIAERGNHRIRRVDARTQIITTVAGTGQGGFGPDDGPATSSKLNGPLDVAVDGSGDLYIADTANHRIRRVDVTTGVISTVAGNGSPGLSGDGGAPTAAAVGWPLGVAVPTGGEPRPMFISTGDRIRVVDEADLPQGKPWGDFDADGDADIAIYRPST